MKLLSIKENKVLKDREEAIKKIRIIETAEALETLRKEVNDTSDIFEQTLKENRETWEKEKEAHLQWKNEAAAEVQELENRRIIALLPVEAEWEKVNNERQALEAEKKALKIAKDELEEDRLQLTKRLDDVGDRELQVAKQEELLTIRRQGVEAQASSVISQVKELGNRIAKFMQETKDTDKRHTAKETLLASKESGLILRGKRLDEREIRLGKERRFLIDLRQTIEREKQRKK